jgi:putative aldouronate transport system permease protein
MRNLRTNLKQTENHHGRAFHHRARGAFNAFDLLAYFVIALFGCISLFPFLHLLAMSFSDAVNITQGNVTVWPRGFTIAAYEIAFVRLPMVQAIRNTLVYTVVGTVLSVIVTLTMAYPLARRGFYGGKTVLLLVTFTMFFNGGMIPTYLVVKELGLINTIGAMVLPGLIATWNLILTRTFLQELPYELVESAKIDGAGEWRIFRKLIVPLSTPIIAVLVLYYGVGLWNMFFTPMLYLNEKSKYPLQLILRDLLVETTEGYTDAYYEQSKVMQTNMKYAAIVIATVPIVCIYPFLQRYFVQGVRVGALKG